MIRINLQYFLAVQEQLAPLAELAVTQAKVANVAPMLSACGSALFGIYGETSIYLPHLRSSYTQGVLLFSEIDRHIKAYAENPDAEISATEIATIQEQYRTFLVVFRSDLAMVNAYLVSPRRPYDLTTLLTDGPALFPPGMISKAPETKQDCEEAGKALAFELGTACGFHLFRIVEAVLKRYWDKETGGRERPKLQTIGNYANEMDKQKIGDEKVVESLKTLARLHRNPIIHPEFILTVDEAIDTIGIARSLISAMLKALPEVPPTTGAPAVLPA